jgi:hypothetical protein
MNLSNTPVRVRGARCGVRGLRMHTPMPPEIDPDAPPPPATDPDPVPDDPVSNPSREPQGDPPVKPPPVRAASGRSGKHHKQRQANTKRGAPVNPTHPSTPV